MKKAVNDKHHLLFPASDYDRGYAKRLREHPYMAKMIPRDTLHQIIHAELASIPCPNGRLCKKAYIALIEAEDKGLVDYNASVEKRIDFLLDIWSFDDCPRTVFALLHEKEVVRSFYKKSGR